MPNTALSIATDRTTVASATPRWTQPPTMLLVEDSRLTAEVFRLFCRRASIRLRRAESVAAALAHLRVYRPDIAVVDLGLPDGNGVDLIARLDRARPRPGRIVAISGDDAGRERALAAGADTFLAKPLHLNGPGGAALGLPPLHLTDPDTDCPAVRNAGTDPLALTDDLRRARLLLDAADQDGAGTPGGNTAADSTGGLAYATQFARALAVSLSDTDLLAASNAAMVRGHVAALRQALDQRLGARAVF